MILNLNNEIDQKIAKQYSAEEIENINPELNDLFGINIDMNPDTDFQFKIYYESHYSEEEYKKYKKPKLLEWLGERKMDKYLSIVHDKSNSGITRMDIGLTNPTNKNMIDLFDLLEEEVPYFKKHRKEIMDFSLIKSNKLEGYDYAALYFIGYVSDKNSDIKLLKFHWLNKIREGYTDLFDNDYYISFIEKCGIEKFKKLLPYVKKALKNCDARMWMEGLDITEQGAFKHKIYLSHMKKDTCNGLIKTFNNDVLTRKLKTVKTWEKVHPEFYFDGFAIGENSNEEITLNLYFRLKEKLITE